MTAPGGRLTTHVLDLVLGRPADGIEIDLWRLGTVGGPVLLRSVRTGETGRTDAPLADGPELEAGVYELVFHAGRYFREKGLECYGPAADPPFIEDVPVRFGIAQPAEHYHVPLLVTPWSYTTYRGG